MIFRLQSPFHHKDTQSKGLFLDTYYAPVVAESFPPIHPRLTFYKLQTELSGAMAGFSTRPPVWQPHAD